MSFESNTGLRVINDESYQNIRENMITQILQFTYLAL